MATSRSDILVVDDRAQKALKDYIVAASSIQGEIVQLRDRFEYIDRAYLMEQDRTDEQQKARLANKRGDVTKLQNMQVPIVMESCESSNGFLTNVFLSEYPMFKVVADPDKMDIALQWNTMIGEDQVHFGWAGEFNTAFSCGTRYNFAPIEIDWVKEIAYKPTNGVGSGGVTLEQVYWEGNRIRSLNPYNTIYDPRVAIHKMHEKGEFAGYIEVMSRIDLKRFLANLGDLRLKNDVKAFEGAEGPISHYYPQINLSILNRNASWLAGSFDWTRWVTGDAQGHIQYKNMYTVVTLYARLMPFDFGIRSARDQTPDVWKLVMVNETIVYAQPIKAAHDYLPIIIGCPVVNNLGIQTKTQAENQMPFQDMTSALWNAKLASARRRSTDRVLYNPLLIDPDHINSPNPAAKIPLRPTAYGRKLEEAVYVFPYQDDNSQYFVQEANGVAEWGRRAQGQNNMSVGQFQKGNKLQSEVDTTMQNAGSRDRSGAIMWETYVFQPIKTQLKSNYLQFTPKATKFNRNLQIPVNIDPVKLREIEAEFEIGDGLLPVQKLVHADVMNAGFTTLAQVPGLASGYKLPPMFSYMMKIQGVDKLSKFEKTPEELQYEQALAAWQNAAAMITKNKPEMTPEDIQKALGPMPQLKQAPTPTQPAQTTGTGVQ